MDGGMAKNLRRKCRICVIRDVPFHVRHRKKLENKGLRHTWRNQRVERFDSCRAPGATWTDSPRQRFSGIFERPMGLKPAPEQWEGRKPKLNASPETRGC